MAPQPTSALGWATIALAAEPEAIALVQAVRNLVKKYPALTADQITGMVQQATSSADAEFDAVLVKIAADQKGGTA